MNDILSLLQCLTPEMSATRIGQLERLVVAMLAMTGRVTMLGLSRWAGEGGSYRTIQRFYRTLVDWGQILLVTAQNPPVRAGGKLHFSW